VIALFATSCSDFEASVVVGSADVVEATFDVDDFTSIDIEDSFDVYVEVGEETSVVVMIGENLVRFLDVRVTNGELRIRLEDVTTINAGNMSAVVTMPRLDALEASGSSSAEIVGVASTTQSYEASGASTIHVYGTAGLVEAEVSGASTIDLQLEDVTSVDLDVSGASRLVVLGANEVSGDLSGASTLKLKADVRSEDVDVSGASEIIRSSS